MSKYDNLLRILFVYETILELTLEKDKHIKDFHERTSTYFLDKTSNKLWNEKIIEIINRLDNVFRENINTYDTKYLRDIRSLKEIFNNNYFRIDSYDRNILIFSQSLHPDYDYYNKIDESMRYYVEESLKLTKQIIETIFNQNKNDIKELHYTLSNNIFDDDVTDIINQTYDEVLTDFDNTCYISAISLCGKIIETALYALIRKKDPNYSENNNEKKNLYERYRILEKYGYDFSDIDKHIEIISKHRNKAVHGNIVLPTTDEAQAIILLTRNTLIKITSRECN